MTKKTIPVTQPFLPPLDEFTPYLKEIWENKWLTNNGPFHQSLEEALCKYLGVQHLSLFSNGTIALITALQALRVSGEVITTPYSFVATAHSLLWNNLKPVFVDIDPNTFNLDPEKVEAAITPQTTAIMPVHCYGYPCDVATIKKIADKHGLQVIYDAAHAFGVQYKDQSLLQFGNLSVLSFHATKVFNTFEGGAIICPDIQTKQRIDYLKNFGFSDELTITELGINGKMSEINAAFGLLQLNHVDHAISQRQSLDRNYREALKNIKGIKTPIPPSGATSNYSYFPVLIEEEYPITRDELYEKLKRQGILSRRYFYPLISDMPMYREQPSAAADNLPHAKKVASKVLCLPIFADLTLDQQDKILEAIWSNA